MKITHFLDLKFSNSDTMPNILNLPFHIVSSHVPDPISLCAGGTHAQIYVHITQSTVVVTFVLKFFPSIPWRLQLRASDLLLGQLKYLGHLWIKRDCSDSQPYCLTPIIRLSPSAIVHHKNVLHLTGRSDNIYHETNLSWLPVAVVRPTCHIWPPTFCAR